MSPLIRSCDICAHPFDGPGVFCSDECRQKAREVAWGKPNKGEGR